jgi:hypothetical protein
MFIAWSPIATNNSPIKIQISNPDRLAASFCRASPAHLIDLLLEITIALARDLFEQCVDNANHEARENSK